MQAARRIVGLAVELAARVQHGHDDFERALVLELGVRTDGDAAAVIGDRQIAVCRQFDFDPGGMACDRFVHGVVDHLGEKVVHGLFVRAADVHAGPAAHGLEPFEDFDVAFRIAGSSGLGRLAGAGRGLIAHLALGVRKQVVRLWFCHGRPVLMRPEAGVKSAVPGATFFKRCERRSWHARTGPRRPLEANLA